MNHYEILGVGPDATEQQIKEAYRREAMKWHPDRHDGAAAKGEADRRFKDLAVAYRILRNPVDRSNYDRQLDQKLRQEYEARQQEQARQQRSQREQTQQRQARQEPPQPDFADTSPQFEEQTASNEDANQMFYEQMLDLAFELAGRGFGESHIAGALIALGCPELMANAVAAIVAKRGGNGGTGSTSVKRAPPAIVNFDDASWDELEPYYVAAIMGKTSEPPLSDSRYKAVEKKRKDRWDLWVGLGIVCMVLIAVGSWLDLVTRSNLFWLLVGVGSLFVLFGLVAKGTFLGPDKAPFFATYRMRYYLDAFKAQYLERKGSPAINSFNWSAFLLNYGWLGYRRLTGLTYLVMFLNSAISLIFTIVAAGRFVMWSIPVMWMVCGVVGHFGNRVYFNMIHAKIRNTIADISPQQAIQELRKNGGTNKYGWIAPTLIGIILSIPGLAIQNEQAQSAARAEQRVQTTQAVIEPPAVDSAAADQAAADQQRLWNEQAATVEKDRYSAYLKQVERQYPFLNPDSPQHDKDAEAWVAEQLNFYKSQGQNPEMALRSAIVAIEKVFDQKRRREYHSAIDPRLMYQMSQVPGGISQTEATAALCQMSPSACR